ncbi:hypothetical protein Golax_003398 [Gossypium laxum]|uniref:Uncharacterized protein n=1 Tax=Gossypium laxum TaxID=34288 RepID=A0A7J9AFD1_9ROSI|nr:hypothetical protein [Gossypium laxum]
MNLLIKVIDSVKKKKLIIL